jgi:hypothetical protein
MNGETAPFGAAYVGSRVTRFTFPLARESPLD